ncbi:unnamed protein product [Schistosoma bovis]|nr:unnamed protein product [Schistosoma bovis]
MCSVQSDCLSRFIANPLLMKSLEEGVCARHETWLSPEFVLQLKSLLTDEKDTSFTFMNEKYIIIRRDPTSFISRCLKKSILFHITPKLCLVGQTVDDNLNNCNPGNHAMSCICDYYKKYNY